MENTSLFLHPFVTLFHVMETESERDDPNADSECSGESNNDALGGQPSQNFLYAWKRLCPSLSSSTPNIYKPHMGILTTMEASTSNGHPIRQKFDVASVKHMFR